MNSKFQFKKQLDSGNFGDVWIALNMGLNVINAVKLIPQEKVIDRENFFREAQILKALEHHNIVRVEDTGMCDDGRIYVAMEYLSKGSIEYHTKGCYLQLSRAKAIMIDILRGLEHAHSNGILHRDIKPSNILIGDADEAKLSDFGLAVDMRRNSYVPGAETYAYVSHLPPEIFAGRHHSVKSDIYACGVTLYRLVNGDSYLPKLPPMEIASQIIAGKYPNRRRYRDFVTRHLRIIINKAMHLEASKRYESAVEMRHALEQVVVKKDWQEYVIPNGIKWTCGYHNKCYEVKRTYKPDNTWDVEVKKGRHMDTLRRVNRLCEYGLAEKEAEQVTRSILQRFVLGKLN